MDINRILRRPGRGALPFLMLRLLIEIKEYSIWFSGQIYWPTEQIIESRNINLIKIEV